MAPKITIIGGGSYQWAPKLVIDLANTPSLEASEIVLCDIDPVPLPRMVELVEHVAATRGIPMSVRATTDQRDAMAGADFVVVNISTGGFASMRHDIEIPERYGIRQPVGDSVGPGGVTRALRNIPVLVGIAHDMADVCPDAWLCNLTNPMTTLCRGVLHETEVKTVGLCHEVTGTRFALSQLLDTRFVDLDLDVTGVNHFPVITAIRTADGGDGLARLRTLVDDDAALQETVFLDLPEGMDLGEFTDVVTGPEWTKAALLEQHQLKLELFRRFGVLPAAGDRHLAEFLPGFITEQSGWGTRWGVKLTTIADREKGQAAHVADFEALLAGDDIHAAPSGEMLAPLIDSMLRDVPRHLPLNFANAGQCPDLPAGAVVESMCTVDGSGIHGGAPVVAPPGLAEHVRRVVASQELTVEAALTGDRERVLEAMLADPLAGRGDFGQLVEMTDELLDATARVAPAVRVSDAHAFDVQVFADPDSLGAAAALDAADAIRAAVRDRGHANVMFATGNSQVTFLDRLATVDGVDWSVVTGFHMDEYVGLPPDHPAGFGRYMHERVVGRLQPGAFHVLHGDTDDQQAECDRYTEVLRAHPLDLCCLGIGENGHLAFNDPPVADFDDPADVKVVELDDACRRQQVGEGHFPEVDAVPTHALTVTVPALLRAGRVLAIVPEARKAEPVRRALEGPVDTTCPASILRTQPQATLYLDAESSALLSSS